MYSDPHDDRTLADHHRGFHCARVGHLQISENQRGDHCGARDRRRAGRRASKL
jgi:hypothetical protein